MAVVTALVEARERLQHLLATSTRAVAFTGAGISTECGVPDFRSPGGFWSNNKPVYFDDFVKSETSRTEAWTMKFAIEDAFGNAKPGRGHQALAQMVSRGKMHAIITQNIDNLHQVSGVPTERIIELHGNGTYATCLDCHQRYEISWVRSAFDRAGKLPDCTRCSGLIKTATVSFGQAMPEDAMTRAQEAVLACDVMLAMGSSLVVYPAAGFPVMAKQNGARLVIINGEATDLDSMADLVIRGDIGDVLSSLKAG